MYLSRGAAIVVVVPACPVNQYFTLNDALLSFALSSLRELRFAMLGGPG